VVGTWFGKKCQHRLDWFHVARRIARIEKECLYLPCGEDFQERLAAHWANLNSMKWMLWNDGVNMAELGMTRVRIGLFQHALAHPEANGKRFESIEAKLDELRSYLYANHESVRGYAEAYRNGERILESPERMVEQTSVNQYWISTVFLGLNHNYYLEGPPPWFETIVFEEKKGKRERSSRFVRHYTTWAEVEAGHRSMVEIIRYGNF
jgi:hypothetical protein